MRKVGYFLMTLGLALLLGALAIFIHNEAEAERAAQASDALLPQLQAVIAEQPREEIPTQNVPIELLSPQELKMTEVEIDGHNYIGYISIPSLELELPVMADWDYEKLKVAPCRYCGTIMEENLVIIAHNYRRHFGPIHRLREGDEVTFLDMDGNITIYRVATTDVVDPSALEEITAGDFDLTLVTCTYGGQTRIIVYCNSL